MLTPKKEKILYWRDAGIVGSGDYSRGGFIESMSLLGCMFKGAFLSFEAHCTEPTGRLSKPLSSGCKVMISKSGRK